MAQNLVNKLPNISPVVSPDHIFGRQAPTSTDSTPALGRNELNPEWLTPEWVLVLVLVVLVVVLVVLAVVSS